MPDKCRLCPDGRNCIFGRYCTRLDKRVEYARLAPCEDMGETQN